MCDIQPPPTAGQGYGPPPPGGPSYGGRPGTWPFQTPDRPCKRLRPLMDATRIGIASVNNNSYVQGNHHAPPPPPQGGQSFGQGAPQGYNFQYSACTGRRKALLIGINYFGQKGQLRGCINDVKNMSGYLNGNFGYAREDMVILTDDQQNPMSQPTKANIIRAMHWLVKDARPNDSLFFHYSGQSIFCEHHLQDPTWGQDTANGVRAQAMAVRQRTWTATKMMAMTRSSTLSTSAKLDTLSMMRCIASWSNPFNRGSV